MVTYNTIVEFLDYVGPYYNYNNCMWIVQLKKTMCRYALSENYIQCKENDQSKCLTMYIDGKPKETWNVACFIKGFWLVSTNKKLNYILEARKGNCVSIHAIKSIITLEDLLIDYNLNHVDMKKFTIMGLVSIMF